MPTWPIFRRALFDKGLQFTATTSDAVIVTYETSSALNRFYMVDPPLR
jgi:hypothetical protein